MTKDVKIDVANAMLHLRPSLRMEVIKGDAPVPSLEEEVKILKSETNCKVAFPFKSYFVTINSDDDVITKAATEFAKDEVDPQILAIRVFGKPKGSENIFLTKAEHFITLLGKACEAYKDEGDHIGS